MLKLRKSEDRGKGEFGWLSARYSFSFSNYFDPEHTGFRDLLVINQDSIEPDSGFGTHPHRDMEIITYMIEGELQHEDSMGNVDVIHHGEVQRMSAGTGVTHSEVNPSKDQRTKLLQIWIQTAKKGVEPSYESIKFDKSRGIKPLITPDGQDGTARINQDFRMYGVNLNENDEENFRLQKGRHAWIQLIHGQVEINGTKLNAGDGLAISEEEELFFKSNEASEFLIMDLK